jgi:hypothetical protein
VIYALALFVLGSFSEQLKARSETTVSRHCSIAAVMLAAY